MLEIFIMFSNYVKTQFNILIKQLSFNGGGEFVALIAYLESKGIVWVPTPPYTPELNGISEIKNRHLIEPTISVLMQAQLPKFL